MIVPDLNLLVYAYHDGASLHPKARRWWESLVNGQQRVAVPWVVSMGFVRLMTNPRTIARPMSPNEAINALETWFSHDHIQSINPGHSHLRLFRQNLESAGVGGNLVTDAHIATIAMELQAEVHSNDSDFARFPGLRWRNPLI